MKNVVFDLGGVVVDWSPERLMEEYTGVQRAQRIVHTG